MTFDRDDNPNSDVGVSADSVLAALETLGNFVKTAGGQSSTLNATDNQNKTDVNVPEVLTGLNALTQKQALSNEKALDALNLAAQTQAAQFASLTNQMAIDHRDQNHTLQILATTPPFVVMGDAAEESANDTDK
jgi:hypothetical protein